VIAWKLKKRGDAGLIHWPYRVDETSRASYSDALGKADPCNRPQNIKCKSLTTGTLHDGNNYKEARSSSRPYIDCKVSRINEDCKAADLNDRSKLFSSYSLSIYSVELTDDRKLGYGFTSLMSSKRSTLVLG
jgi:hypothetical protein